MNSKRIVILLMNLKDVTMTKGQENQTASQQPGQNIPIMMTPNPPDVQSYATRAL